MKVVAQKVQSAKVLEGTNLIAKIENGLVVYVGIEIAENENSCQWLIDQISKRVVSTDEILILSQFTLFAKFKCGKPSFHTAEVPSKAERYFYEGVEKIKDAFPGKVQSGIFGSKLDIVLCLNIPNAEFLETCHN